ncbi:alkaline phosphatase family protein, partial [Rubrivirga sp.]|uniref:alkaline phosphatase family protein n=1 Tax=Rubrivirga sp. TaxID=1885344 RepID=UPI003C7741DB
MFARSLFIFVLLALVGCAAFNPIADVVQLPDESEAVAHRAGGLGERDSVRFVIHVSIDGLRPDAVERLPMPALTRLRLEGAWTHNARTDADYRITLPNHAAQLTSRPVLGDDGHGWTTNRDPRPGVTIHSNRGRYVPSVFDVAHDHGLSTSAFVSKSKFSIFDVSYDGAHGAPDTTGADDGRDKIDTFVYDADTDDLVDQLVDQLQTDPAAYTFVHLRDPDAAGHLFRWSLRRGSRYLRAVEDADRLVGRVLEAVEGSPRLSGRTAVIVTADHGGSGRHHQTERPFHYTVPFYVWSPGVPRANLYDL